MSTFGRSEESLKKILFQLGMPNITKSYINKIPE